MHPVALPGAASTAPVPTLLAPGRTEDSETSEGAEEHPLSHLGWGQTPHPIWVTRQCLGLAVLSWPSPLLLTGCQHPGLGFTVSPATLLDRTKAYLSQEWLPGTRTRIRTLPLCFLCWHLS